MSLPISQVIAHLQQLRNKMESLDFQDESEIAYEKSRCIAEQYTDVDASVSDMPRSIVRHSTAIFKAIKGDWFFHPKASGLRNRLLYIHGCGGAYGRLSTRLSFAAKIAEATGAAVLAVDYRLFPHSAALADCLAAYAWILTHGPDGKCSALNTYVLGEAEC